MATSEERKKQVLEHVRRSIDTDYSKKQTSEGRKQKIMDHVNRSKG
jgi:hypothetical protein